jgi:hypothetical protein
MIFSKKNQRNDVGENVNGEAIENNGQNQEDGNMNKKNSTGFFGWVKDHKKQIIGVAIGAAAVGGAILGINTIGKKSDGESSDGYAEIPMDEFYDGDTTPVTENEPVSVETDEVSTEN